MDKVLATGMPEYMLVRNDDAWEVLLNLAGLIRDVDKGRYIGGRLWAGDKWKPECKVCAVGAVYEKLVDPGVLVTLRASGSHNMTQLWPAYKSEFGDVGYSAFLTAVTVMQKLNDQQQLRFSELSDTIQEAYDAYTGTR